jgi:hypothetical protein
MPNPFSKALSNPFSHNKMPTEPPKKYVKINGVMKLNPEYKKWKEAQDGGKPATTVANPSQALPVVTNMEDHEALNDASLAAGGNEIPLSESTNETILMMQEPEISVEAGMQPDTMVDELGSVLNKYEVPMGLMNKLMMLSEFDELEFMIDDSGSMRCSTDSKDSRGQIQTRWQEAQTRLKEMMEILGYLPFQEISICFLNRPLRISLKRNGRDPASFLSDAYRQIDQAFLNGPSGTTPFFERLKESFARSNGRSVARYFFGDGTPNGGAQAAKGITDLLKNRRDPAQNPMTFLSCTNEDDQVEWMKEAEEVAPYCSECDDFADEAAEVLLDQGEALPYTKGFYLVCALVAAMNPEDLDAMDESVPFTKATLDNLLGIENSEENYKHYFDLFLKAQKGRPATSRADQLKKNQNWQQIYAEFLRAPVANQIPAVQAFKQQLAQLSH